MGRPRHAERLARATHGLVALHQRLAWALWPGQASARGQWLDHCGRSQHGAGRSARAPPRPPGPVLTPWGAGAPKQSDLLVPTAVTDKTSLVWSFVLEKDGGFDEQPFTKDNGPTWGPSAIWEVVVHIQPFHPPYGNSIGVGMLSIPLSQGVFQTMKITLTLEFQCMPHFAQGLEIARQSATPSVFLKGIRQQLPLHPAGLKSWRLNGNQIHNCHTLGCQVFLKNFGSACQAKILFFGATSTIAGSIRSTSQSVVFAKLMVYSKLLSA